MSLRTRVVELEQGLNPVLVKEVRQALRSKRFRGGFGFTVLAGLVVAISIVIGETSSGSTAPIGAQFFTGVFACLTGAVLGFVPMTAFTSMSAEFDEDTYDMLVVSRLRPRQIMFGKLLAAGVMALLYFSAFGFFVVFAFLFGGVDPTAVFFSLPVLAVLSLTGASLALCLSSLSQKRVVRAAMMVLLAALLVWGIVGMIALVSFVIERGIDFGSEEVQTTLTLGTIAAVTIVALSLTIGASQLAHPEENRSTPLRVASFVMAMTIVGWGTWVWRTFAIEELLYVGCGMALLVIGVLGSFFTTERETLGRRVEFGLPDSKVLRLFALPWLPGGARGFLWMQLSFGVVLAAAAILGRHAVTGNHFSERPPELVLALMALYMTVYSSLFAGLRPSWREDPKRIALNRILILLSLVFSVIGPMLYGMVIEDQEMMQGLHVGNPLYTTATFADGEGFPMPVLTAYLVCVLVQLRRVLHGTAEVLRAPGRAGR